MFYIFRVEMVDFRWNYMALMLKVYKQNLPPILKFLEHAYQGVWGKVTDSNNNPISNVTINIGGKLEVTHKKGKFELVHNFQAKIMLFTVEKSRLIRRDIIMESLAPYLQYHTKEQVKIRLEFLMLQFPNYAPLILTLYQDHK